VEIKAKYLVPLTTMVSFLAWFLAPLKPLNPMVKTYQNCHKLAKRHLKTWRAGSPLRPVPKFLSGAAAANGGALKMNNDMIRLQEI